MQWAPRATTEPPHSTCDDPLLVSNTSISEAEVVESVKSLKRRKAAGSDGIPPEFWKAICTYNSPACRWAVLLCNKVWTEGSVPTSWHEATVAAIFKKGDPACCENYRPISLLAVGYKIFAAILLRRLKDAGAEDRIWPTQFGFRSGCGCADALFIARRKVENAWARKNGNLLLLALDWAKAFDSISPAGLVNAMSRFGIPYHFCSVVRGIYNGRHLMVRDGGVTSGQHPQCFGISQGCPLSPFLFSIVMTLLIQDAKAAFLSRRDPARTGEISELMYADDTLILAVNNEDAEIYMQCIEQAGRMYGLQLNWNKLEVLPVRCEARIKKPNGDYVVSKESLLYLGSFLCDNGSIGPELNRRLGAARAEFQTLCRVWNHAVLPKAEKIRIFEACVLSKLLYCLHTAWLNKAELRRLNAFQSSTSRTPL